MNNNVIKHPGKTARDHKSGAHARNLSNKQARADWQNDSKAVNYGGMGSHNFPYGTCNGKRNKALKRKSGLI